jgi:glutamyl-tRNA synthetase
MQFRDEGYLPQALLNYLVRLGWSHGDQEIFSIAEMIEHFDLKDVNGAASTFNMEKLLWLNHHYLMHDEPEKIVPHLIWNLGAIGIDANTDKSVDVIELVKAQRERCKTLVEMANASRYFYQEFESYEEKSAKKAFGEGSDNVLAELKTAFSQLENWEKEPLHDVVKNTAEKLELGLGKVAQPLRVAICGSGVSPSIDITLALLGKEKTLARLQRAISHIQAA